MSTNNTGMNDFRKLLNMKFPTLMRNKSTKTQINLSQYNSLDFGIINLSPEKRESNNSRINLHTALGGQALAMFLHSYDDHLNDGDIPASHLALLVRSA